MIVTAKELREAKEDLTRYSKALIEMTPSLDAHWLIVKMNERRGKMEDYIRMLEQYIGEHEGTWMSSKPPTEPLIPDHRHSKKWGTIRE
jgi:hypothetical protein